MARSVQTNFNAGELSPSMYGRSDLSRYAAGAKTVHNCITMKEGGAKRRSGTRFIAASKDSSKACRLIEYVYGLQDTYVLEFGDEYIRFYRDSGQLIETGTTPTEVSSPYSEADLEELKWTQSADILYLCHPDYPPYVLFRSGASDILPGTWTMQEYSVSDGPYLPRNISSVTLTPAAAATGAQTVTASSALFASTDVGRVVRISNPATGENWGWGEITAYSTSTTVTVNFTRACATTNATTDWYLGAWSETTGYPHVVTISDGRLWWATTDSNPDMIWSSRVNRFGAYSPSALSDGTIDDTYAIIRQVDDNQVNAIRWLFTDDRGLLVMSGGGIFVANGADQYTAPTPDSMIVRRQNRATVAATVEPHRIGDDLLFLSDSARQVHQIEYRITSDRILAPEISVLARHVLEDADGAIDSAAAREPDQVFWMALVDGMLAGVTIELQQEVLGFHRHTLGGSFGDGDPVVESIAAIRNGAYDQLWLVVKRTVNAATVRYIEVLEPNFQNADDAEDAYFVDCGLSLDSATEVSVITGLDHLELEMVDVLVDGAVHPRSQVQGGRVELEFPGKVIHAGLPYTSTLETLPLVASSRQGDTRTRLIRPDTARVLVHRTAGVAIGQGGTDAPTDPLETVPARRVGDDVNEAPPLRSGVVEVSPLGSSSPDPTIKVEQTFPLPMHVLQIAAEISDGRL